MSRLTSSHRNPAASIFPGVQPVSASHPSEHRFDEPDADVNTVLQDDWSELGEMASTQAPYRASQRSDVYSSGTR
jgi:hypothetical protein